MVVYVVYWAVDCLSGIFSTEDKALEYISKQKRPSMYGVEEWTLDND